MVHKTRQYIYSTDEEKMGTVQVQVQLAMRNNHTCMHVPNSEPFAVQEMSSRSTRRCFLIPLLARLNDSFATTPIQLLAG